MKKSKLKETKRRARHQRIRKHSFGFESKPRLCVHRSLKNMYAQLIDDQSGKVLLGISTLNKEIQAKVKKNGGNIAVASVLGMALADLAKTKGITRVCFDRGGYLYHGRVKAFAEAARKNGLEF